MITIFCDFCQFSAKKLALISKTNVMIKILHNFALFWVKNANFFAEFFGENKIKNHNIGPWSGWDQSRASVASIRRGLISAQVSFKCSQCVHKGIFTRNFIFVLGRVVCTTPVTKVSINHYCVAWCWTTQRAILNFIPAPQGWNLLVHPQGWTLSTV
jgi:hypothetical protein